MIKKYISLVLFFVLVLLIMPNSSFGATSSEIQTQIQAIMAQIKELQQQLVQMQAQQSGTTAWCHMFNTNSKIGNDGDEVNALQIALQKEGFSISNDDTAKSGGTWEVAYSVPANFGESTAAAVTGFQEKYRSEILTPLYLKYGTGYVGKSTRAKLNQLYGCGGVTKPPVSAGYLQIEPSFASIAVDGSASMQAMYQPPMPKCPEGFACPQVMLARIPVMAEWISSNPSVASVDRATSCLGTGCPVPTNVFVKGISNGTADIKAAYKPPSGTVLTATAKVTVGSGSTAPSITVLSPNGGEKWQTDEKVVVASPSPTPNLKISADVSKTIGITPKIYKMGTFWFGLEHYKFAPIILSDMNNRFNSLALPPYFSASISFDDFLSKLPNPNMDRWLKIADDTGVNLKIIINYMPRWLSANYSNPPGFISNPDAVSASSKSPPKCFEYECNREKGWSSAVYEIVNHYSNKIGLKNVVYVIGNEPELADYWIGNDKEYYKLYHTAVLAAKKASNSVKLAPAFTTWNMPHWCSLYQKNTAPFICKEYDFEQRNPMMYDFIKYSASNSLPIDEMNWHIYATDDMVKNFESYYGLASKAIKDTLSKFGYNNTKFYIGEFNYAGRDGKVFGDIPERSNEFNAAFILRNLNYMAKAGIDSYSYFEIFDNSVGNFGFLYALEAPIIKPSYNLFRMLSMFGSKEIYTKSNNEKVTVIGTKDNDKIVLLISNFDYKTASASIEINNIPFQSNGLAYQRYLIDASHSNSYPIRERIITELKKTNDPFKKAIEINNWKEVALDQVKEKRINLTTTGSYQEELILEPMSANLIILETETCPKDCNKWIYYSDDNWTVLDLSPYVETQFKKQEILTRQNNIYLNLRTKYKSQFVKIDRTNPKKTPQIKDIYVSDEEIDSFDVGRDYSFTASEDGNHIYSITRGEYHPINQLEIAMSHDRGQTWTNKVVDSGNYLSRCSIATSNNLNVYMACGNNYNKLTFFGSMDGGKTWSPKIVETTPYSYNVNQGTSIAVSGNNIYIAYGISKNAENNWLKFAKSSDNGNTWTVNTVYSVTNTEGYVGDISVRLLGNDIYLKYSKYKDPVSSGEYEGVVTKSTDLGKTWKTQQTFDFNKNTGVNKDTSVSSLDISGNDIYVGYGNNDLSIQKSSDRGVTWNIIDYPIIPKIIPGSSKFSDFSVINNNIYILANIGRLLFIPNNIE